jgi:hypothetical protein
MVPVVKTDLMPLEYRACFSIVIKQAGREWRFAKKETLNRRY